MRGDDRPRAVRPDVSAEFGAGRRRAKACSRRGCRRHGYSPSGTARRDELLRHQRAQDHARKPDRLRPAEFRRDARQPRRGERRDRQFHVFRFHHRTACASSTSWPARPLPARAFRRSTSTVNSTGTAGWSRIRRCNGLSNPGRAATRSSFRSICGARRASCRRILPEVYTRQKEILYSSRTREQTDRFKNYQRRCRQPCRPCSINSRRNCAQVVGGEVSRRAGEPRRLQHRPHDLSQQKLRGPVQGL